MLFLMTFFQQEKRFRGSRCCLLRHKELAVKTMGKSKRLIQSQQAASAVIQENPGDPFRGCPPDKCLEVLAD
jgi:hypothetical protein